MVLQARGKCHFSLSHPDTWYRSEKISPPHWCTWIFETLNCKLLFPHYSLSSFINQNAANEEKKVLSEPTENLVQEELKLGLISWLKWLSGRCWTKLHIEMKSFQKSLSFFHCSSILFWSFWIFRYCGTLPYLYNIILEIFKDIKQDDNLLYSWISLLIINIYLDILDFHFLKIKCLLK